MLRKNFVRAGKPVEELETNVDQLSMFDGLSEHAQRSMLTGMIGRRPARARDRCAAMLDAMLGTWVSGDVDGIAGASMPSWRSTPEPTDACSPTAMRAGRTGSTNAWTSPERCSSRSAPAISPAKARSSSVLERQATPSAASSSLAHQRRSRQAAPGSLPSGAPSLGARACPSHGHPWRRGGASLIEGTSE